MPPHINIYQLYIPKENLHPRPSPGLRHAEKGVVHHIAAGRPYATVSLELEQLEFFFGGGVGGYQGVSTIQGWS